MTFFDKSLLGMTSVVFTTLFGRSYLNYQVKLAELKSVISEKEALKLQIIETKQEIVALSSQIKAIPVSSNEHLYLILGLTFIAGLLFGLSFLPDITTLTGMDSQGNLITAKLTAKLVGDPGIMQIFFSGSNEEILVANLLSMLGYKNLDRSQANYDAFFALTKWGELETQLAEKKAMMSRLVHQSGINDNAIQTILRENPELIERFVELQELSPPII